MGSIGLPELIIIALIGLLLLGPPIAVLVWLIRKRSAPPPNAPPPNAPPPNAPPPPPVP